MPPLCPVPAKTITVYRTVHGSAITDPDSSHRLFVRQSAVDGRLLTSLDAWDAAGLQHDARSFFASLSDMALCFNFSYVDAHGDIGYWHVGKLPIRPANADPNLPLPGDGRYDWQGFEKFTDLPHDIDPPQGYLVNWNNKPAVGWWSPSTKQETAAANAWSTEHQVVALQQEVAVAPPLTLTSFAQVPRDPAYIDNPARILMPYVLRALAGNAGLSAERALLAAWNERRRANSAGTGYATPAVVLFDRLFEHLTYDAVGSVAGASDAHLLAGVAPHCTGNACHLVSVDNLDTPTMKWELTTDHVLLNPSWGARAARGSRTRVGPTRPSCAPRTRR